MKRIRCLFIDDKIEDVKEQINEWKEDASDEILDFYNSFTFDYEVSNEKTDHDDLFKLCEQYDFIILDQMAVDDDGDTQLAQGISRDLDRINRSYCIYTGQTNGDARNIFKNVNIFKKTEIVDEQLKKDIDCDGGFRDMLHHIRNNTGFNTVHF